MVILFVILSLAVSFLATAGLVWLLCWALTGIGIIAIGSFTIVFSWKLALAIWIIMFLLMSILKGGSEK